MLHAAAESHAALVLQPNAQLYLGSMQPALSPVQPCQSLEHKKISTLKKYVLFLPKDSHLFPLCLWPCCRTLQILLPLQGATLFSSGRQQVALDQGLNSSHLHTTQQADLTPHLVPIPTSPFRKDTHSNAAQAHTTTCRYFGALNTLRK